MRTLVIAALLALVGVLMPVEGAVAGCANASPSHSKGESKKEAPRKSEGKEKVRSLPVRSCGTGKRAWIRLSAEPERPAPKAERASSRGYVEHLRTSLRPAVLQVFRH